MAIPLLQNPDVAFERLYEEHVRDVYRYALAVLRNPADAEGLRAGSSVTVRGRCTGFDEILDVALEECELVRK